MSGFSIGMLVEGMVSALLVVTIVYCLILNRKLNALRADQTKLREVIQALDRSTRNAENIIGELRETASSTQEELDGRIDHARSMADRLNSGIKDADVYMNKMSVMSRLGHSRPEQRQATPVGNAGAEGGAGGVGMPTKKLKLNTDLRLSNLMRGEGVKPTANPPQDGRKSPKRSAG